MRAREREKLRAEIHSTVELAIKADDDSALHLMLHRLIESAPTADLARVIEQAARGLSDCGLEILANEAREQAAQTRISLAEIELHDATMAAARVELAGAA